MKNFILLAFAIISFNSISAQHYAVTTSEKDSFSVAFVKLMNSAANQFRDCRGKLLKRSWQGDDYELTVPLPGSFLGIVRDFLGNDVKIEYRGFADSAERDKGIRKLVEQIKNALGNQLDGTYDRLPSAAHAFYGMNVKDKHGFFGSNIEIFSGNSSDSSYLLSDNRDENKNLPDSAFFILKIDGGLPLYFYNVPDVFPPDTGLDNTICYMMEAAEKDFSSFREKRFDRLLSRRRGTDTIYKNGFMIFVSYNRSEYSASLFFPAAPDSMAFKTQWEYYVRVLQAATGKQYAYFYFDYDQDPHIKFYCAGCSSFQPAIELELQKMKKGSFIRIKVLGSESHPQKRGLDQEDFDNGVDWD